MSKRIEAEGRRPAFPDAAGLSQLSRAIGPSTKELMRHLEAARRELRQGHLDQAGVELALVETAIERERPSGEREGEGLALVRGSLEVAKGRILQRRGDVGGARARFEAAARCFEEAPFWASEAWADRDYGVALCEVGRSDEARKALEQARERGDQSYETVLYLGVLALRDGNPTAAEPLLRDAAEKEPLAPEAVLNLAMALELSGRSEADAEAGELFLQAGWQLLELTRSQEALEAFRKAVRLKPDDPYARLALGETYRYLERYEEAIEAVKEDSDFYHALGTRGAALLGLDRPEEALKALERAVELEPTYAFGLGFRGEALRLLGRPQEALESLDRAVGQEPNEVSWLALRGELLRLLERYEEALEVLDQAISLNPDLAFAHGTRGAVLSQVGRLEEALEAANRAVVLDGAYAFGHTVRGEVLGKLGRLEEALAVWDRAVEVDPKSASVHARRGDVLCRLDRLEEALEELDRAVSLDSGDAFAQARRGEVLCRLDRLEEALEALDRAVELDPMDAFAHARRGEVLRGLNRLKEALEALDRGIELDQTDAWAQVRRADVLRLQDRDEEALEAVERTLALEPSRADRAYALVLRADVLRLQSKYKEALEALDHAVGLQPDLAFAHGTRGEVLRALERHQEAEKSLRRAVELDPKYAFAITSLGELYRTLGKYQEARRNVERALEITGGRFPWAEGILGLIELETGEFEAALKAFDSSVAQAPEALPFTHVYRGYSLRLLGRLQEAISALETAVERFPKFHAARVHLADALLIAGRVEEAAGILREVAKELEAICEPDAWHLSYLASSEALLGRYDEAMRTFLDALSIAPTDRTLRFDLALTVMRSRRYDLGLEEYQRAVKEAEHDEHPRQRGLALTALRDLEAAIEVNVLDHEKPLEAAIALLNRVAATATSVSATVGEAVAHPMSEELARNGRAPSH